MVVSGVVELVILCGGVLALGALAVVSAMVVWGAGSSSASDRQTKER